MTSSDASHTSGAIERISCNTAESPIYNTSHYMFAVWQAVQVCIGLYSSLNIETNKSARIGTVTPRPFFLEE